MYKLILILALVFSGSAFADVADLPAKNSLYHPATIDVVCVEGRKFVIVRTFKGVDMEQMMRYQSGQAVPVTCKK